MYYLELHSYVLSAKEGMRKMNIVFGTTPPVGGVRRGVGNGKEYPGCFKNGESNLILRVKLKQIKGSWWGLGLVRQETDFSEFKRDGLPTEARRREPSTFSFSTCNLVYALWLVYVS